MRCADFDTALESVAGLHGVSANALLDALPQAVAVGVADVHRPVRAVVSALAQALGSRCAEPAAIHYFHGTRAADPGRFTVAGVLPLNAILEEIWVGIAALAPEVTEAELGALRHDLERGRVEPRTYQLRVSGARDVGPYGNLVRDVLFHPDEYGSVDYFAGGEIAVDICEAGRVRFGIDFAARFHAATAACIVEFTRPADDVEGAMASAIWYLESVLRGERTTNAHWSYDGEGHAVDPGSIVAVEVVG